MESGYRPLMEGKPGLGLPSRGRVSSHSLTRPRKAERPSFHFQGRVTSVPTLVTTSKTEEGVPGDSSLPRSNALQRASSLHTPSLGILELSILVQGQTCSQELCLLVLTALGPPRPGPFTRVPELLQSSQSSIYPHGWAQSFGFLNSFFVSPPPTPPPPPPFMPSAVDSDRASGRKYVHARIPSLKSFRRWYTLIGLFKKHLRFQTAGGKCHPIKGILNTHYGLLFTTDYKRILS